MRESTLSWIGNFEEKMDLSHIYLAVQERFYCNFYMYRKLSHQSCNKKGDLFWSIPFLCLMKTISYVHNISGIFSIIFWTNIVQNPRKCKFRVYFLGHESTLNAILISFSFLSANFTNWNASSRTFASEILILFTILWFLGKFLDNVLGNTFWVNVLGDFTGLFRWFFTIFTYVV